MDMSCRIDPVLFNFVSLKTDWGILSLIYAVF